MKELSELMQSDNLRMSLLSTVSAMNLPDCYIAAGFVRNRVWDYLHGFSGTALNDVDVIYFSQSVIDERPALAQLSGAHPEINWQLKNQAYMHVRNGDQPYLNCIHAMEHWPEIETAMGVRLDQGELVFVSPFNISTIFDGRITHNKKRSQSIFIKRIKQKRWLDIWPKLKIRL
jgi:hypothetical protein